MTVRDVRFVLPGDEGCQTAGNAHVEIGDSFVHLVVFLTRCPDDYIVVTIVVDITRAGNRLGFMRFRPSDRVAQTAGRAPVKAEFPLISGVGQHVLVTICIHITRAGDATAKSRVVIVTHDLEIRGVADSRSAAVINCNGASFGQASLWGADDDVGIGISIDITTRNAIAKIAVRPSAIRVVGRVQAILRPEKDENPAVIVPVACADNRVIVTISIDVSRSGIAAQTE